MVSTKEGCPPGEHPNPEIHISALSSNPDKTPAEDQVSGLGILANTEDSIEAVIEHSPLTNYSTEPNATLLLLMLWAVGIVLAPLAGAMCYAGYMVVSQFSARKWAALLREYFPTSIPFMIIEAVMALILGKEKEGGEMERIL